MHVLPWKYYQKYELSGISGDSQKLIHVTEKSCWRTNMLVCQDGFCCQALLGININGFSMNI